MSERTPSTMTIRNAFVRAHPFPTTTDIEERYAEFDRWLTEVERTAAERAWEECLEETAKQGTIQEPGNPYRAEVYRQKRKEQ